MKGLKNLAALKVILLLSFLIYASCRGDGRGNTAATIRPSEPQGRLVVGVNSMNGNMFDGWDSFAVNGDVWKIINGYSTIMYTDDDQFIPDSVVVRSMAITENPDGGKTFTFEINDNLTWNDGTEITAKDYVFAMLFNLSPQAIELGANRWGGGNIYEGFEAYNDGSTNVLSGVRLLGDYSFSVTVAENDSYGDSNFPFWYEITYASVSPLPIHVLAPGCDVVDNGGGAEITGPFTLELLQSTVDNGSTGYRYTPYVTCGPYKFIGYDADAHQITLEVNDSFLGEGPDSIRPMIKDLVFYRIDSSAAIDALEAGIIDLLIRQSGAANINPGLDLANEGKAGYISYARNGYGRITFHCDWGPTQFAEVRRAIAYTIDREEFVRLYTGGFGSIVHSRIGSAQWMYGENRAALESDLTAYTLNLQRAREELEAGGWTLNAQGGPYTTGTRYKRMSDGSLMALVIEWFSPDSNAIGEMLGALLNDNAESIGMDTRHDWGDSSAFEDAIRGIGKRYNMINGGVGFAVIDSPWYYYQPEPSMFGIWNINWIIDEELNRYTQEMRNTAPGDFASFSNSWLNFVKRFNLILPDLPLYCDEYFNFFNPKLKDFNQSALYPWTSAILRAYVAE